jgi:hypothetical protein
MALKGTASVALIASDVIASLKTNGYIDGSENFDETKFASASTDGALATAVVASLEAHGITLPPNAQKVINALPLILSLADALTK